MLFKSQKKTYHFWYVTKMVYFSLQICEEFLRISGISLESTFMSQLDRQTPKLLSLFNAKGGAVGQRIKSQMMTLIQVRGKKIFHPKCILYHVLSHQYFTVFLMGRMVVSVYLQHMLKSTEPVVMTHGDHIHTTQRLIITPYIVRTPPPPPPPLIL